MVFSAFNRLGQDSSGTEGTGIGLIVTKSLVESMQGIINFKSTHGIGTTFYIELPTSESRNQVIDIHTVANHKYKTNLFEGSSMKRILYIEDNLENGELMRRYIDMVPNLKLHIVEIAETGLNTISTESFDLALMDINLPSIDGIIINQRNKSQARFSVSSSYSC